MLRTGVGDIVWSGAGVVGDSLAADCAGTIDGRKSLGAVVVVVAASVSADAGGAARADVVAFENGAMRLAKLLDMSTVAFTDVVVVVVAEAGASS